MHRRRPWILSSSCAPHWVPVQAGTGTAYCRAGAGVRGAWCAARRGSADSVRHHAGGRGGCGGACRVSARFAAKLGDRTCSPADSSCGSTAGRTRHACSWQADCGRRGACACRRRYACGAAVTHPAAAAAANGKRESGSAGGAARVLWRHRRRIAGRSRSWCCCSRASPESPPNRAPTSALRSSAAVMMAAHRLVPCSMKKAGSSPRERASDPPPERRVIGKWRFSWKGLRAQAARQTTRQMGDYTTGSMDYLSGRLASDCLNASRGRSGTCRSPASLAAWRVEWMRLAIFPADPQLRRSLQARVLDTSRPYGVRFEALEMLALNAGNSSLSPEIVRAALDLGRRVPGSLFTLAGTGHAARSGPASVAARIDRHVEPGTRHILAHAGAVLAYRRLQGRSGRASDAGIPCRQ